MVLFFKFFKEVFLLQRETFSSFKGGKRRCGSCPVWCRVHNERLHLKARCWVLLASRWMQETLLCRYCVTCSSVTPPEWLGMSNLAWSPGIVILLFQGSLWRNLLGQWLQWLWPLGVEGDGSPRACCGVSGACLWETGDPWAMESFRLAKSFGVVESSHKRNAAKWSKSQAQAAESEFSENVCPAEQRKLGEGRKEKDP